MRHDRFEASRDRMLTAADDLATGLAQALLVGRHAVTELEDYLVEHRKPRGLGDLGELHRLIDETIARLARVELLFGIESPTATNANVVVTNLRKVVWAIEPSELQPDLHERLDPAGDAYQAASKAYREFSVSAREAVENYGRIPVRRPMMFRRAVEVRRG
jgi:hypothetical protein